ncbi:nonstructural protein [Microviridae sp.]|nr:nonstructural protein [Microviridae sp.]
MKVFAVFDSAANAYLTPFFFDTVPLALRAFTSAVNDEGHQFHRHADDYTLFEIGMWDELTGELGTLSAYNRLCGGNEVSSSPSIPFESVKEAS